ncbi:hypothetical protein ACNR9Q_03200 [Maribacter sp. X9]|uniref:hypothetical protein n=1 Tax=Maribacter sp. X9 TaxID=3402159 RepID=UPI003AF406D0
MKFIGRLPEGDKRQPLSQNWADYNDRNVKGSFECKRPNISVGFDENYLKFQGC